VLLLHQTCSAEIRGEKVGPFAGEIQIHDFPNRQHNFYKLQRNTIFIWLGKNIGWAYGG
jgi:hypothetical protein